jgi:hypothetical protein
VDLPRERVVVPGPTECSCYSSRLAKLGEDVTETLKVEPRQWKVIPTMRERLACRACETITQAPALFHSIARGPAGPGLLAMILEAKFGQQRGAHPLPRLADRLTRQPDDQEGGKAAADPDLHLDRHGLDAAERETVDAGQAHAPTRVGRRAACVVVATGNGFDKATSTLTRCSRP